MEKISLRFVVISVALVFAFSMSACTTSNRSTTTKTTSTAKVTSTTSLVSITNAANQTTSSITTTVTAPTTSITPTTIAARTTTTTPPTTAVPSTTAITTALPSTFTTALSTRATTTKAPIIKALSYEDAMRSPEKYVGGTYKVTGRITQYMPSKEYLFGVISTEEFFVVYGNGGSWRVLFSQPAVKIIEGDKVEFIGIFDGRKTAELVDGSTKVIPQLTASSYMMVK